MKIDNVLILGAGLGTRMGPVGQELPKLLWPVFEKTLLELQVEYANSFKPKNIFINTYYESKKIRKYIEENDLNVIPVEEESLLDIGGGIHNLAERLDYNGTLLILNGDQFLFFDDPSMDLFFDKSLRTVVTLMGIEVEQGSNYNELILDDTKLIDIMPPTERTSKRYLTYSGVSIVNLDMLSPVKGVSKFFDSVANYKSLDVQVVTPHEVEYSDFGTAKRYLESMREVLIGDKLEIRHFLLSNRALDKGKVRENFCYGCSGASYSINLTQTEIIGNGSIILKKSSLEYPENSIVCENLISKTN